ncbi:hypothetical protein TSAR_014425 [Trichomalopsis sarcophagae]|uniref:Uncharacterized protein n=1 Tax=Trichomalopsis sarcophagae TaxID=543379 RepID=A0A232F0Q1_9HYME|nr:hypothetical protein TSAR_014425 [Trichomalopsis sarcophagae]
MKRSSKPVVRFKIYPKTHYIGGQQQQQQQQPAPVIATASSRSQPHRDNTQQFKHASDSRYGRRGEKSSSGVESESSEETYESSSRCADSDDDEENDDDDDDNDEDSYSSDDEEDEDSMHELAVAKALAAFRKCDEFLQRHRIRPEFFCRYRERLALQAWLLQRATAKASRNFSVKTDGMFSSANILVHRPYYIEASFQP